ncbi:hypothetical protein QQF64_035558 [Cirrhinus molitorella]|uniref:Uncharacterized protein n=1 Tax=Cirrhinus molitorella TaxID=172907 RepID=A0ABR3NH25_9TELE
MSNRFFHDRAICWIKQHVQEKLQHRSPIDSSRQCLSKNLNRFNIRSRILARILLFRYKERKTLFPVVSSTKRTARARRVFVTTRTARRMQNASLSPRALPFAPRRTGWPCLENVRPTASRYNRSLKDRLSS